MSASVAAGDAVRNGFQGLGRRSAGLRTKHVDVDGLRVVYDEGHADLGSPILMLHGFSGDRSLWLRFAAGIKGHHLLIPDLIGHGQTPFIAGADYSAPGQADRILRFMDAIGVDRAHVIGSSMGGFVAATLARRAPSRVLSLGLVCAAGVSATAPSAVETLRAAGRNPFFLHTPDEYGAFYALTMKRPPYIPGIVMTSLAHHHVAARTRLEEIFDAFHGKDLLDDALDEITAPTWIAWGAHDQVVDPTCAPIWNAGIAGSTLTIYDDLGHLPMLEAPARTRRDYLAFLATVGS